MHWFYTGLLIVTTAGLAGVSGCLVRRLQSGPRPGDTTADAP